MPSAGALHKRTSRSCAEVDSPSSSSKTRFDCSESQPTTVSHTTTSTESSSSPSSTISTSSLSSDSTRLSAKVRRDTPSWWLSGRKTRRPRQNSTSQSQSDFSMVTLPTLTLQRGDAKVPRPAEEIRGPDFPGHLASAQVVDGEANHPAKLFQKVSDGSASDRRSAADRAARKD